MNLEMLKPWNWFKHEENASGTAQLPVSRLQAEPAPDANSGSLASLHREIDRWFDDSFRALGMRPIRLPGSGSAIAGFDQPRIDVSGDANSYQVSLDVPGVAESDLALEINGDRLTIRGKTESRDEQKDKHYYRVERHYGAFQRTLSLPDDANADEIDARLEQGVLRLTIPRRESAEDVRRIPINS